METADSIRNNIIDKLLTISNKEYLTALYKLINTSSMNNEAIKLSEEQLFTLNLSEDDIKNNRVVSQEKLDEIDLEWLKDL